MRIVMHLDMDAFFAAIEERDKPWLQGKPIVIGADPGSPSGEGMGRGVVSTANYLAREYGIHSAQPISVAWRLSEEAFKNGKPRAVFVGVQMGKYGAVSREIMNYLKTKALLVEQASVDEAYLEFQIPNHKLQITNGKEWEEAEQLAKEIKKEIWDMQKLTCSIGIGPNKFIAKVASDLKKPNGLTIVPPEQVLDFLAELPIKVIPGIGPKAEERLSNHAVKTIEDLRMVAENTLHELFGKWGKSMWQKARGIDESPVVIEHIRKSIGEQVTFDNDTLDAPYLVKALRGITASVGDQVIKKEVAFKTISLIVRFSDFETKTRSQSLPGEIRDTSALDTITLQLFLPFLDARENPYKKQIRLLGVRVEKLSTGLKKEEMIHLTLNRKKLF